MVVNHKLVILGGMNQDYDLVIIGGGLAGMSLAAALADTPLRLALIEAAAPPVSAPAWDERCIALNDASRRIFTGMGLWEALGAQAAAITATHISERGRFGVARFTAAEAGLKTLGHNTPLRALGAALMARVTAASNIRLYCPAQLAAFESRAEGVRLHLQGLDEPLHAQLLVACDGAQSSVRQQLGIGAQVHDYQQSALVTAVRVQRDPQGLAYERFAPEGPFALLPKPALAGDPAPGHPCSLIWTLPHARAENLRSVSDEEFLAQAQSAFGERLGRFLALGKRLSWPLTRTLNDTLTAPRIAFCGNAAQSLHPVAAQGFNLGLRDVTELAARLRTASGDCGAPALLAAYAEARAADRQQTAAFTDRLVRLFSNRAPGLAQLRHLGLLALDLAPPIKREVMRQNLGHRGLAA